MESELLYIGCNGHVAAVDPASGHEIWRTELSDTAMVTAGEDVAVLNHGAAVFAGCHGHLFCLEASTGALRWHNELNGMGWNDVSLSIAGKAAQITSTVEVHTEEEE